jgi:hypothetical protein
MTVRPRRVHRRWPDSPDDRHHLRPQPHMAPSWFTDRASRLVADRAESLRVRIMVSATDNQRRAMKQLSAGADRYTSPQARAALGTGLAALAHQMVAQAS